MRYIGMFANCTDYCNSSSMHTRGNGNAADMKHMRHNPEAQVRDDLPRSSAFHNYCKKACLSRTTFTKTSKAQLSEAAYHPNTVGRNEHESNLMCTTGRIENNKHEGPNKPRVAEALRVRWRLANTTIGRETELSWAHCEVKLHSSTNSRG